MEEPPLTETSLTLGDKSREKVNCSGGGFSQSEFCSTLPTGLGKEEKRVIGESPGDAPARQAAAKALRAPSQIVEFSPFTTKCTAELEQMAVRVSTAACPWENVKGVFSMAGARVKVEVRSERRSKLREVTPVETSVDSTLGERYSPCETERRVESAMEVKLREALGEISFAAS